MTTDLTLFKNNALTMNERFQRMMEDTDRVAGMGRTSRRISIRGGRFREIVGGDQQRVNSSGSMNVVIVRASPISRTFYEGVYDPEKTTPPRCWSADTEKPSDDVPAAQRMSSKCASCQMNVKGSGATGTGRACRFSMRLAVCIEGNMDTVYQMQLPATSIFGEVKDQKMGMQAYAKFLKSNQLMLAGLVTQMYFDENSETPKLFFKPVRPLDQEELEAAVAAYESDDAQQAVEMTVYQADTKPKEFAIEDDEDEEVAPPPASKKAVAAKPKAAPVEVDEDEDDEEEVAPPKKRAAKASADVKGSIASTLAAWDND
jgi:hypothetical protein